jgi:hypothetical protein
LKKSRVRIGKSKGRGQKMTTIIKNRKTLISDSVFNADIKSDTGKTMMFTYSIRYNGRQYMNRKAPH